MTYDDDKDFVCTCDGFDISQECPVHRDPKPKYPCACRTLDDLDGCQEMVDAPDTICEFCEDCRQPEDGEDPRITRAEYDKDHREGPGWRE